MTIKEYPFPDTTKMEELRYCVFPDAMEDDDLVLFHATLPDDYESILVGGFKSADELSNPHNRDFPLKSVSYAKRSSGALSHIRGRHPSGEAIIIAVRFDSVSCRYGMTVNASDVLVFDGSQPTIIGICRVPANYVFH